MSSVTKPIAASTSPVTTRPGSNARQVSSEFGAVSELYAQTGVRSEGESPGFDEFGKGSGRNPSHDQPQTLKLHGTSRTFAMLYEEANAENSARSAESYYDDDGYGTPSKPAFSAYMAQATSVYEQSTKAINGETKNRGSSLNLAF